MMGHREVLRGGYEYDVFSPWRKHIAKKAGKFRRVKQAFNRRIRRENRRELTREQLAA